MSYQKGPIVPINKPISNPVKPGGLESAPPNKQSADTPSGSFTKKKLAGLLKKKKSSS